VSWQFQVRADQQSPSRRPNIILLVADDLGYAELGVQGNTDIPTPHIDSIAGQGLHFTTAYVTDSYCAPSRAGLMTGRYQSRFGAEQNHVGAQNHRPNAGVPPSEPTLAEVLRSAGYGTGIVGKWHLGSAPERVPLRRGFDSFFGFLHEGHFYVPPPYDGVVSMLRRGTLPDGSQSGRWVGNDGRLILSTHGNLEPAYDATNPIVRDDQPVHETEYLTRAITREAVSFIGRHRDRPFFLYVAYNAPHSPLQAPLDTLEAFAHIEDVHRRIFAAMVSELDLGVGQILQAVDAAGLAENTLVFFLSDHGGPTAELTSSNLPLRGGKGNFYEGGVRVPLLMRWPGRISAGQIVTDPVSSLDIFATATAAAGIDRFDIRQRLDGIDLMPYLRQGAASLPHRDFFWRRGALAAFRSGDWKIVRPAGRDGGIWQLYNLREDPTETTDRAAEEPRKLEELRRRWQALSDEMASPVAP
jgi:arylsulfatase A-like enzyme